LPQSQPEIPPLKRLAWSAIAIFALSVGGRTESRAEGKPHIYGRVVVLSIGIEKYQFFPKQPADFAENDATAFGAVLSKTYGFTPDYLLGEQATGKAIRDRIAQYFKQLGPSDTLIVFFAGHGQVFELPSAEGVGERRAGFLVPYDADVDLGDSSDPKRWEREALDMRELVRSTMAGRLRHVLFLVDACCSGFMTRGNLEFRMDLRQLLEQPSRAVVAATTEKQKATSDKERGHGIFTGALLDVLKAQDAMSVTDVFVEVRKRVVRHSGATMTPQMSHYGKGDGEFVFLPLAIPAGEIQMVVEEAHGIRPARGANVLSSVLRRSIDRLNLRSSLGDVIEAFEAPDYHYAADAASKARVWEQKRSRLEENAATGDVLAMEALHYCLAKGLGLDQKDELGAYRWAKLAYETNHAGGKHVLGRCLFYPIGTTKNPIAGLELMREAGAEKFPISFLQIGMDFMEKGDVSGARQAWQRASDLGVYLARVYLADLQLGFVPGFVLKNAKSDPDGAISVVMPAAKKELPDAQMLLARIYAGFLEKPDKPTAKAWLERAARNGHAQAQGTLARELAGNGLWTVSRDKPLNLSLEPNPREARRWAEMAAAQDDSNGLLVMAHAYVVAGDFKRALEACRKAEALNHPCAFLMESKWYGDGDTVHPKDPDRAFQLGKRAADMGNASGQTWIGALYADHNVPKDQFARSKQGSTSMHHALHYWTLAAEQEDEMAHKCLVDVADMIRANPDAGYWELFQRVYPEDVAKFRSHSGLKP
jgi:TPR repeat protein